MGGADPERSHKGEEYCIHKTMRQKWSPIHRRPTPRETSSSTWHKVKPLKVVDHSSCRSDLPLLQRALRRQPRSPPSRAATPTYHPDIPPLALSCRTNWQPANQATQGSRPQTTAITTTHPGPPQRRGSQQGDPVGGAARVPPCRSFRAKRRWVFFDYQESKFQNSKLCTFQCTQI
jgi:hypothetical protein